MCIIDKKLIDNFDITKYICNIIFNNFMALFALINQIYLLKILDINYTLRR